MRAALSDFYTATTTPDVPWYHSGGWLEPTVSVCDWFGVQCDANRTSVTGIVLPSNTLSSEGCVDLSPTLALLPDLTVFNLNGNDRLCLSRLDMRVHSQLRDLNLGKLGEPAGTGAEDDASRALVLPDPSSLTDLDLSQSSLSLDLSTSPLLESLKLTSYKRPFNLSSIDPRRISSLWNLHLDFVEVSGDLAHLCPMANFSILNLYHARTGSGLPSDVARCWPQISVINAVGAGLLGLLPSFANLPQLRTLCQWSARAARTHAHTHTQARVVEACPAPAHMRLTRASVSSLFSVPSLPLLLRRRVSVRSAV